MKNFLHNSLRALFLSLAVLLSLPMLAVEVEIDGINYELITKTKEATVIKKSSGEYSGEVVIPESVEHEGTTYSVTSIGYEALYQCLGLTSVTIPNSVTSIGEMAFFGCFGLTSVTIGNSVTSIGSWAFYHCSGLASVTIPNSVTSIGSRAFLGCSGLTSVTIGNSVTSIGGSAFSGCSRLTSVTIPNSVTSIGGHAFNGCSGLTSVTIPNSITSIGEYAFGFCTGLTSVTIPNSVTSIGDWAFLGCSGLTSVTIPNSVTSIGVSAFFDCSGLTSVTIPNSVTSIEYGAFSGCSGLTSVTIPNSVTSIGERAFSGCSGLTSVHISDLATWCSIGFGDGIANPLCYAHQLYLNGEEVKDLVIPNSVTSIGDYAFYRCDGLTSVTIPNSVTGIGSSAFYGCGSLKKIYNYSDLNIAKGSTEHGYVGYYAEIAVNNAEVVDDYVFGSNGSEYALYAYLGTDTELVLPEAYNNHNYSIGENAFKDYSDITSITIPNSVTSIGNNAFDHCTSLKEICIKDGDSTLSLGYGKYDYGSGGLFKDCPLESVYIGRNIACNSRFYAFNTIPTLKKLAIGEYVTNITDNAFYNCTNLNSVSIGNNVKTIGAGAFDGCNNLINFTIGSGVLSIGTNQSNPTKVIWLTNTQPSGYKNLEGTINYVANENYDELTNKTVYKYLSSIFEVDGIVYVPVNPSARTCDAISCSYDDSITSLNIGKTVLYKGVAMNIENIMPYIAYQHTKVQTLNLSNNGNIYACAFYGCSNITNATISNEGSIGTSAFEGAMTSNDATLAITSKGDIDNRAFYGCSGITNATVSNEGKIGTSAFEMAMTSKDATLTITCKGDIENRAFYGCSGITNATVSNEGKVGRSAFEGAMTSNDATLAITCKGDVDARAFYGCSGITNATVSNEGKIGTSAFEGAMTSNDAILKITTPGIIDNRAFYKCTAINTAEIDSWGIGNDAFRECRSLSSIILSDNIKYIGNNSFQACSQLSEVKIPYSTTTLGDYCFSGNSSLSNIELSNGLETIGQYCFNGCSIQSISVPSSVTNIGNYTFNNCKKLTNIIIKDRNTELSLGSSGSSPLFATCPLDSVYIGGRIKYNTSSSSGYSPFYRNTSLRTIVITDEEEEIYNNEFYGCTNLKNVTMGDGVKKIGNWAFSGCSNLDYFSFGRSMQSIGDEAFSDCTKLAKLISYAEVPPACGSMALDDINKWECILQIPKNSLSIYQNAEQWKEFFFIEDVLGSCTMNKYLLTFKIGDEVIASDSIEYGAKIEVPTAPEKEGHTFNGWVDVPETMPANDVVVTGSYSVNKYLLTFKIGDEVIASDSIKYGAKIEVPTAPEKEGHTFNGWDYVPETMPANDVVVTGSYSVNKYLLTFKIGDEVIASDSIEYSAKIEVPTAPEKEGHTFNGWVDVPETMPANDVVVTGSYSVNKYLLTFMIGNEAVASYSVAYGTEINAPAAPEKEGHSFNGWVDVPETMPANDVVVTGSYSVNKYLLTFMIGDEAVASYSVAYGTEINAPAAPEKEGHTFNGWVDVPETMPANDVVVTGSYSVNKYLLTFMIGDEAVASYSVAYGTEINAPTAPEKEGHTFNGWDYVPETMPANDVVVVGSYTVNIYKVYYYVGDELVHMDDVAYGESIPIYEYTPTNGDKFLGWEGEKYETMPAKDITYKANIESCIFSIDGNLSQMNIYDINGRRIENTKQLKSGVYIVNGKRVVVK